MSISPRSHEAHDRAAGSAQTRSGYLSTQPLNLEAERKRRELDTAMEEELHQIVAKTGQAQSGSWRLAEPRREEANSAALSRRARLPWIMVFGVLILALSGVGYQALRKSPTAELKPAVASLAGLGLKVELRGNLVHVGWDKSTPLIASAKRGVLSIKDGTFQNDLTLGADLLSRGSVNYYHKTEDLTFHLQVVTDDSKTTSEVVQLPGTSAPLSAPLSIDLGPLRARLGDLLGNSKAAGNPAGQPEVTSNKETDLGMTKSVLGLVPQRPAKAARYSSPQLSPRAISTPPLKQTPAPMESNSLDLTALKTTKAGVPQTWKLVVEYLGLTPVVSAQPAALLSSNSPAMEGFSQAAGTDQLQAVTPPPDQPSPSRPQETAKKVSLAEESPVAAAAVALQDSILRDSAVNPIRPKATEPTFSSLVQCPENLALREIPFASGRPDRKTVVCGEAVTIIRESGDWVRIRTTDGFEGHILRRFVK